MRLTRDDEADVSTAPIPLVDLAAAHAEVADEVAAGLRRAIERTAFILGPDVAEFEREFASFSRAQHCVGLSSGTDAIELVLRASGIGHGDEVILPVNTFIATALAVVRAGATPVFVDCDADHLLLWPDAIAARLTENTRAIVPVHLYGQMAPMEAIEPIAQERGLLVLEDFAQAHGATRSGRGAGTWSQAGATSFYPGKNLGAYGDAGAVITDDADMADALRALRNYGSTVKYEHPKVGFNCRMDALQAVVLRAKLHRLASWTDLRRRAAARYDALLEGLEGALPVPTLAGNEHAFHLYVIRVSGDAANRARVLEHLNESGVQAAIHYPAPLHLTGAFRHLGYRAGEFPAAEAASGELLSLPLYPQITEAQQERVVASLRRALEAD